MDKRTIWPNRVREHRVKAGLTLKKLSEQIGISIQMLGFIERGKRDMRFGHQKAIATALGLAIGDLLNEEDQSYVVSPDERILIDYYRALDARSRHAVRIVAESLSTALSLPPIVEAHADPLVLAAMRHHFVPQPAFP